MAERKGGIPRRQPVYQKTMKVEEARNHKKVRMIDLYNLR